MPVRKKVATRPGVKDVASYVQCQKVSQGEVEDVYEQISWACTEAALDVENEDPGVPNHTQRLKWAQKWRSGAVSTSMEQYTSMVLENATIAAAVGGTDDAPTWGATDNDVQFQVNSLVDRFAALP